MSNNLDNPMSDMALLIIVLVIFGGGISRTLGGLHLPTLGGIMVFIFSVIKIVFYIGLILGACVLLYRGVCSLIEKFKVLNKQVQELEKIKEVLSEKLDFAWDKNRKLESKISNIRTQLEKRDHTIVQKVFKDLSIEKPSQQSKLLESDS